MAFNVSYSITLVNKYSKKIREIISSNTALKNSIRSVNSAIKNFETKAPKAMKKAKASTIAANKQLVVYKKQVKAATRQMADFYRQGSDRRVITGLHILQGKIYIVVRGVRNMKRAFTNFGRGAVNTIKSVWRRLGQLKRGMSRIKGSIFNMGNAMTAGFGAAAVSIAGDIDIMRIRWNALKGAKGPEYFNRATNFAKKFGFQLRAVHQTQLMLTQQGFQGARFDRMFKGIATMSAMSGEFEGTSRALLQIISKGTLQAEEANQLAERGIDIWKILQRQLKEVSGTVFPIKLIRKAAEAGIITGKVMEAVIVKNARLNEKQLSEREKSFIRTLNKLKIDFQLFMESLGRAIGESGLLEVLTQIFEKMTPIIKKWTEELKAMKLPEKVVKFFEGDGLNGFINTLKDARLIVESIADVITTIKNITGFVKEKTVQAGLLNVAPIAGAKVAEASTLRKVISFASRFAPGGLILPDWRTNVGKEQLEFNKEALRNQAYKSELSKAIAGRNIAANDSSNKQVTVKFENVPYPMRVVDSDSGVKTEINQTSLPVARQM